MLQRLRQSLRRYDWWLLVVVGLTLALGLATHYSIAVGRGGGDLSSFVKQLVVALLGLTLLAGASLVRPSTWRMLSPALYVGTLVLLAVVLAVGQAVHGTRGWLGAGAWRFQPVEVAKFTAVIATAAFVARRARTLNRLSNLVGSTVLAGATIGLVLLQPDAGSAAILGFVWLGTLLVIGIKRRYLVGMFVAAALASLVAWQFVLAPYQKERLSTFFVSSERASAQGYNVRQAIIAVGSGGLFGRGPGSGSQSQLRFLPEASTDFVVAVIGEELGFVGLSLLFGLFFLLGVRLWLWLARCRDDFASFVLLGTVLLFAVELFMNAGMAVGLFPVVGIPLPLVSAGGSSLVAHLALLGVAQSVVREERAAGYRLSQVAVV